MKNDGNIEYSKSDSNAAKPSENQLMTAQVFALARAIPAGKVISYGALGAHCEPPISGYICGRIMNNVGDDVPWWRVAAKNGGLPIAKRNPVLAARQRSMLEAEGVEFDDENRVQMNRFSCK